MPVFDRYLFKNLLIATVFTAVVLACIILLTQSLRFLELVINAGASSTAFWILTALALPRFFEIILPIALMAATVFVYNRMTLDSELTVMRALGAPPMRLARPALVLALIVTVVLWAVTTWLAPTTRANMHLMRNVIKAQYSTLLFQEGVFTLVRPGLTVYVRERSRDGELYGLMIHDSRTEDEEPVTVLAQRGQIVATEDGQQVLVFDGSRQEVDEETGVLNLLRFGRYTIDLPDDSGPVRERWQEPEERTFWQLLRPSPEEAANERVARQLRVEMHRQIVSPLLAPGFTIMALGFLLLGTVDRRGQTWRIIFVVAGTIVLQSLYLTGFNMAAKHDAGLVIMYLVVFAPLVLGGLLLSERTESLRRRVLYGPVQEPDASPRPDESGEAAL